MTKEDYKEIVGKCVSKVLGNETLVKVKKERVKALVEGYVGFYRHKKKVSNS